MSYLQTCKEILDKVEDDLDLAEETFIDRDELKRNLNEAIRDCEAEIHTIYEDYFLVHTVIPIQANVQFYPLPSDIYAKKIRGLIFNSENNATGISYQIKRIRDFREIPLIVVSDYLQFLILNDSKLGDRLAFYPVPSQFLPANIDFYYLRRAKRMVNESDVCDIPEFVNYILAHMKYTAMKKEGHPLLGEQMQILQTEKDLMVSTLSSMIIDNDNKISLDLSIYEEHS